MLICVMSNDTILFSSCTISFLKCLHTLHICKKFIISRGYELRHFTPPAYFMKHSMKDMYAHGVFCQNCKIHVALDRDSSLPVELKMYYIYTNYVPELVPDTSHKGYQCVIKLNQVQCH